MQPFIFQDVFRHVDLELPKVSNSRFILIKNNKDKYDQMLNLFDDDKGDVDLSLLHQQLDKTITNDIRFFSNFSVCQ